MSGPAIKEADEGLTLETTVKETGQQTSVLRDDQGLLAYPGHVPEKTISPSLNPPKARFPATSGSAPREAAIEPTGKEPKTLETRSRPRIGPKSATDAPGRVNRRGSALPPALQRTGTNVSELQLALWNTDSYPAGDDTSSSESASDDEDLDADVDRTDKVKTAEDKKARRPSQSGHNDLFRRFRVGNENYRTKGRVSKRDGRLAISVKDTSNKGYLAKVLAATLGKVICPEATNEAEEAPERTPAPTASSEMIATPESIRCPELSIVIMVIGSRGDVQPFLKLGKVLKEHYGHRVRIATHPAFREFVEKDSGLEFFSVGGDPSELMAFMVKNPGMIPTLETVRAGDIGRRRAAMAEMFEGFWRACINDTDDEKDARNRRMMGGSQPFIADLIIANPPSFAHVHCAEALGVPLVLAFTFPYTPTKSFPHPLATIKKSNVDVGYTNFMSYPLVEMMVWQGLGDLVNGFRIRTLGLDPVSTLWAPGSLYRMNVPFSYLWSPSLVPKPSDWGDEIDVSGFVFLDLASSFAPPDPLTRFFVSGNAPIYIGFGSIVVDDADAFTRMIIEAVKLAGVRALVSKGWGGLGSEDVPDNIFMLDNVPHDWLFPRVKACVIHGGAGTTAIALKCGRPTMVVPFFGDQFFWGSMIGRAKAGPEPIPYKSLSAEKLAEGIKYCLTDEAKGKAQAIADEIAREGDGAENACAFFHKSLALSGENSMRCSILQDKVAVWNLKGTSLRLSALAAIILAAKGYITWRRLRLIRHCEWNDFEGPGEPVTGVLGSIASSFGDVFGGVASVPSRLAKISKKKHEREEKRRKKREQAEIDRRNDSTQNDETVDQGLLRTTTTGGTADEGYISQVTEGVGRSAAALASAPIDLSVALAQGFHNAPRLYGDDTVRRPTRVTGISSGLRAAGSEFVYGVYDAWTGVVRLPVRGARNGGVQGFAKGVGLGVSGLALKNIAALTGPVGYTLKGIEKQVERRRRPIKHIRRARVLQGQREVHQLSEAERDARIKEVVRGWEVMRSLWETVERKEREKGVFKGHFGARRRHDVGEVFESVPIAESALEAANRGEDVQIAMKELRRLRGIGSKRPSEDMGEKSTGQTRPREDSRKPLGAQPAHNMDEEKTSTVAGPMDLKDETLAPGNGRA
ncbi:Sterol 3-beta-glucosyltransferase UGT80A2 [Cytospora mali]|uniref:Sterol 3-beta-glucosyltransferase UGT80A2 n=1 Tax=Cytospora mali TaxID=578113 RepID=A0A194VHA8_CYTMA|nr:Sterol 3-beta-glucosyltransferase UGT80A2 [Valsa mali var. pyri (nom. inval.)]